jgi:hypothetical protein
LSAKDDLDRLEVLPVTKGEGLEPEEAPARRVQTLPLEVSLAPSLPEVEFRHGRPALNFEGQIPVARKLAPVTSEMTAGEAANLLRERCTRCIHFRNDLWRSVRKVWEGAPENSSRKVAISEMLLRYTRTLCDGVPTLADLRGASDSLWHWGVCEALTEERNDLFIAHPEATCPPDGPNYYRDRDLPMKREASSVFDKIMRAAQGRK